MGTGVLINGSDGSGTVGSHTIDVIEYTGTSPTSANFVTTNYCTPGTVTTNVAGTGSNLKVEFTYTNAQRTWNSASGVWDTLNTTSWQEGDQKFSAGDAVTFDDTGTGGGSLRTVTLNSVVTPGSVTFNNTTGNYTVSGTGSIGGNTALTKSGSGTVTMNPANSYFGGTTISAGTLVTGSNTALGTGAVALTGGTHNLNGQTLANNVSLGGGAIVGSGELSGVISGSSALSYNSTGNTLTLTGANTYGGGTTISAGMLAESATAR